MKQPAALLAVSALLVACSAKEKEPTADSPAAAPAAASAIPLESLAGDFSWVLKAEPGDSVIASGTSHQNADGTGWAVSADTPNDTTRFTAQLVGDSVISTSAPYKDNGALKDAGELVLRAAGLRSLEATRTFTITISPAAKPDSVLVRARSELTKK